MLENTWNRILDWFTNTTERRTFILQFNNLSREAFIAGFVLTLLEANISIGDSQNKLKTSRFLASGFRIKVIAGKKMSRDELLIIGTIILSNASLVRQLISLGWDTLEIYETSSKVGLKWGLLKFSNITGLISPHQNLLG